MSVAVAAPPRPLRGSRLAAFYPPIPDSGPSLSACDSAFQLQEYIAMLIRHNPHDVEKIVNIPGNARVINSDERNDDSGEKEGKGEVVVDEACWIYEHLRRLAQDLSHPLITTLQQECSRSTCPEMKAGEWLYLCVAHGNDGAMEHCCAVDYIIHTLDSATALLNSPRAFPSRLSIPPASLRHFSSLARRLGRIFAHAYFHHREAFEAAEAETALYARFLALTMRFSLVPAEFLVIPPRMAGLVPGASSSIGLNAEREKERGGERGLAPKRDADHPRLLNASLETQQRQRAHKSEKHSDVPDIHEVIDVSPEHSDRAWSPEKSSVSSMTNASALDSPRRLGRNRTDTMVHSDYMAFNEEMKGSAGNAGGVDERSSHGELERGDDGQGGLRSGWDEISLDVGADEHELEGEHEHEPHHANDSDEAEDDHPELDIDSDPLQSAYDTDSAATKLYHPYQTTNFQHLDDLSTDEPTRFDTTPPSDTLNSNVESSLAQLEDTTADLPHQNELIVLAESPEVCLPASQDSISANDAQSEATSADADSHPSAAPSDHVCTAAIDSPDDADVGPGGFIILGEPGIMCTVENRDGNGKKCSAQAPDDEIDVGAGVIAEEEKSVKPDTEDAPELADRQGAVEDKQSSQKQVKKEHTDVSGGADVSTSGIDPNMTLEEDLNDVEKVLQE